MLEGDLENLQPFLPDEPGKGLFPGAYIGHFLQIITGRSLPRTSVESLKMAYEIGKGAWIILYICWKCKF